jgi:hypothetical protein
VTRSGRHGLSITSAVLAAALVIGALFPNAVSAHGALVAKSDLPLPEWLFIYGSLIILVVSFVALLAGWREPHLEDRKGRPLAWLSTFALSSVTRVAAGLLGVGLFILVIWTGLEGTTAPDRNFSLTFVFATFWVGLVLISALFGDVYRAFNPWRSIGLAVSATFAKLVGQRAPAPLRYPERLGRWPAVIGLFGFLFLELIWGSSGFAASGISTREVAIATLVYSACTFIAMTLFGVERWIERGEAFSVYFRMFASLSPLAVEDGRIVLRLPFSGATRWATTPGSLALVLLTIAGTTFDGAQEGILKDPINSLFRTCIDGGLDPLASYRLANLVYLLVVIAAVTGIFWAGILGMRIVERKRSALELSRAFAHAFIPIALAYVVAHYFSYIFYLGQAQFSFLLSDPFGDGSDIFGTADSGIDYGAISGNAIWYVQFGAIVVGHVAALALGHDRALKIWGNNRDAAWSQVWMLVMMMFFSVLGLYLLSQANG